MLASSLILGVDVKVMVLVGVIVLVAVAVLVIVIVLVMVAVDVIDPVVVIVEIGVLLAVTPDGFLSAQENTNDKTNSIVHVNKMIFLFISTPLIILCFNNPCHK
jgi:hypothetical protein